VIARTTRAATATMAPPWMQSNDPLNVRHLAAAAVAGAVSAELVDKSLVRTA